MSVTTSCTCSAWQDPNGEHRRSCPMWEFPARPPVTADLTPAQAARHEAIEAAPFAEEALQERVARVIHDADCLTGCGEVSDRYRRLAVAAIDVMRGAADDGAIGRVLALAKQWADEAERRDQTAKRLPDQPAYRVEIHRLLVGARHQRRAARQLRAAASAPATAEGDDRG